MSTANIDLRVNFARKIVYTDPVAGSAHPDSGGSGCPGTATLGDLVSTVVVVAG